MGLGAGLRSTWEVPMDPSGHWKHFQEAQAPQEQPWPSSPLPSLLSSILSVPHLLFLPRVGVYFNVVYEQ